MILALAACATPVPQQSAAPSAADSTPLAPIEFPLPPPKIVLVNPFVGTPADLEPLPLPTTDLWDRIVRGYAIPDIHGPLVDKWEQWYAQRPDYVARMVERSRRYLYHIVTEVEARGMPTEIALLPIVESAFNPERALREPRIGHLGNSCRRPARRSASRRTGGSIRGATWSRPRPSALDYLQKLNAEFNDWPLSLAAYNWGEGNVRRAVARNRARGFACGLRQPHAGRWMKPATTCPSCRPWKNIIANPQKYGLVLADVPDAPYFTVVRTTVRMDVKRAAELAELPLDEFLALNPQHNRPVISGADDYAILLPIDKAEIFAAKLDLINQPLVSWQAHRMKAGETLSQIAIRYGMSIETLRSVNGVGPRRTVPTGYALLVPMQQPTREAAESLENAVFTTVPAGRTFFYTVHHGDTLTAIAGRYGVTTQDLRRWNRLSGNGVRTGRKLRVTSDVAPPRSRHARVDDRHRLRAVNAKATKSRGHRVVAVRNSSGGGGGSARSSKAITAPAVRQ